MNKEVIYIDVDDDVTAIIGKIKKSKEKIVALVPPKRAGTLQSAVNLRLLDRMAKEAKKQLVLVTHNQALVALAANTKIPVAKNLQSKPELAEIPALAVDDGDDIIDGGELPVGDHADTVVVRNGTKNDIDDEVIETIDVEEAAPLKKAVSADKAKGKVKIPDFNMFRKRLFLIGAAAVLIIALLVWAFGFAPRATVVVTARTSPIALNVTATLGDKNDVEAEQPTLAATTVEEKKDVSVEFDATGQKDIGDKATGTVRFSTNSIPSLGTIPAGTRLTSASGRVFTTDEAVALTLSNYTGVNVDVTATSSGTQYNNISGNLSGAPSGVSATVVGTTSGGTTKVVRVVAEADLERARGQLIGQSTDDAKRELIEKLTDGSVAIESSFSAERGEEVLTPKTGEEVPEGTKAKLTVVTTYRVVTVTAANLEEYLGALLESRIDTEAQYVYDDGFDAVDLGNYKTEEGKPATIAIITTARIGPKLNEAALKELAKGKRYGDVQKAIEAIDGVASVDTKFSHFWVWTVPNNTDKITIEFNIQDE